MAAVLLILGFSAIPTIAVSGDVSTTSIKPLAGETWITADVIESWPAAEQEGLAHDISTDELRLTLTINGISLPLLLTPSHVGSSAVIQINDARVNATEADTALPQLYTGTVTDDPDSWVRLSREVSADQIASFSGQVMAYGTHYELSAKDDLTSTRMRQLPPPEEQLADLARAHDYLIFPPRRKVAHEFLSNTSTEMRTNVMRNAPAETLHGTLPTLQQRASLQQLRYENGIEVPGALRIAAVVDSHYNEHHGGRGVSRALSLINVVDGIYQEQFGVALVLDSVIAYTNPATDPMRNQGGAIDNMLESFRVVSQQEPQLRSDLTMVHLFTGLRDPNGVLGLGWIDTACRTDGYNVSLSTPFAYDALLAAHEMAHNLGALHDDNPSCNTDRSNIMWPRLSSQTAPAFSQCSLNAVRTGLAASCNLENIDLAIGMQSRTGPDGSGRSMLTFVSNRDPVRSVEKVRSLTRLPSGSRVLDVPDECTVSNLPQSGGPEVVCELGDIEALGSRSVTLLIGLSSEPVAQWARVDVASLVAADSQPSNNRAQLDLRTIGSAPGGQFSDDESVTVASANDGTNGLQTASQPVPGTQSTQVFLPDGSTMVVQGPQNDASGVTGGSAGTGAYSRVMLLVLCLLVSAKRWRRFN